MELFDFNKKLHDELLELAKSLHFDKKILSIV